MTTPSERTKSLVETRRLLVDLASKSLDTTDELREISRQLLRHYPGRAALAMAHLALPHLYGPMEQRLDPSNGVDLATMSLPEPSDMERVAALLDFIEQADDILAGLPIDIEFEPFEELKRRRDKHGIVRIKKLE